MFFKYVAIFAVLSGLTTAYTLPEGSDDGIYTMHTDAQGKEIIEYHGPVNKTEAEHSRRSSYAGLPSDAWLGCAPNVVTLFDYTGAVNSLLSACDNSYTIGPEQHIAAVSGSAVAYMCNYGTSGINACHSNEANAAYAAIATQCLNYQAGYAVINSWAKSYGYDSNLATICGNE